MKFTIFGATGFIGSRLTQLLRAQELELLTPSRDDFLSWHGRELGHVVYAIGVTADFRRRPLEAARAHVSRLTDVLEGASYQSFVYLSSTRLYSGGAEGREEARFTVDPGSLSDLYNLSKLLGESLVLAHAGERARVVRLSNVYGPDWESENFLMTVIRDSLRQGSVTFGTAPLSSKDYIAIDDVTEMLTRIAMRGTKTIYNLASGTPVTNSAIASVLREHAPCRISYAEGAPLSTFPPVDIKRIRDELGFAPRSLLLDLPDLLDQCRKAHTA